MSFKVSAAIIGVHKCATTSLLEMLRQHPQIATHFTGEWPYFLKEENYREQLESIIASHFPSDVGSKAVVVRDTSLYFDRQALGRFLGLFPEAKLIVMLRDPVARAYSAFTFCRSKGYEPEEDFSAVIERQKDGEIMPDRPDVCHYIRMGFYHKNLKEIETLIPRERILILRVSDLYSQASVTCQAMFEFLGLPRFEIEEVVANQTRVSRSRKLEVLMKRDTVAKKVFKTVVPLKGRFLLRKLVARLNTSQRKYPKMTEEQRARLVDIFAEENEKLLRDFNIKLSE